MSKKIENLISELGEEFKKEDMAFAISILDLSTNKCTTSFGGTQAEMGIAIMEVTNDYTEIVKKDPCPCFKCLLVRQMMGIDIYEHSDIEIDEATFNAFMNGGNSDE